MVLGIYNRVSFSPDKEMKRIFYMISKKRNAIKSKNVLCSFYKDLFII